MHGEGFPGGSGLNNLPANAGDVGSVSRMGRTPAVRKGNTLQYPCLENSMSRGAWWATVQGVTKNWI